MKRNSFFKFLHLLGLLLFLYILHKIDLHAALNGIRNFNPIFLIFYVICFTIMIILKSARWRVLLNSQLVNLSLTKVLKINIVANFWGTITLGRIGEIIKLDFLLKENQPLIKSMVSIFFDRIYDIITLLIFSIIGIIYFLNIFLNELTGVIYIIFSTIIIITIILLLRTGISNLLRKLLKKGFSESKYQTIENSWNEFTVEFSKIKFDTMWKMTFLSIAAYLFFFLTTYIIALGFNVHIPFIYLSLCIAISSIVSLFPISISGIGTREAIFIFLLNKIFIGKEMAVLISFIDGTVLGLLMASLFWLVNYLYDKLKSMSEK